MTRHDLHQYMEIEPVASGELGATVELALLERDPQEASRLRVIERPPGRELTQPELLELVRDLAYLQDGWQHLVEHAPEQRRYHELSRNDHVSVWLICWSEEQDTGFHDHDLSTGAVAVVAGQLREERLTLGGPPRTRIATAGESFTFSAADIHRISNPPGEPAVTIHAYSPPLRRIGAYDLLPDGGLRRHSVFRRLRTPSDLSALTRKLH